MKISFLQKLLSTVTCVVSPFVAIAQDSPATKLLKERNAEFRKDVVKVTDGVYSAVGYRASTINMIEGTNGIIIVDTGQTPAAAREALAEFRKLTAKPVKAVILTHSHGGAEPKLLTATGRNYYHTVAQELRAAAKR
jgi:hypothetical protein